MLAEALGTSAILVANRVAFTVNNGDFRGGSKPTLTVVGITGAETATITRAGGETVRNGIIDAASEGSVTLESAGEFAIFKDATVADVDLVLENSN